MDLLQEVAQALGKIKAQGPLVHQLTNFVTVNDCANVTLALGASPVMTSDSSEVEEMVSHASALVINIGTLNAQSVEAMILAGRKAASLGIPVVFDPVGVGATRLRTATAERILREVPLAVVRGNMSEIKVLAGSSEGIKGVDSIAGQQGGRAVACQLSHRLGAVVAITGAVDIVAHGDQVCHIHNGHPLLASVTGTGCMASALIGCFAAVIQPYTAAIAGIAVMGIAGEIAQKLLRCEEGEGLGMYRVRLLDAISSMTPERVLEHGKFS